MRLNLGIALVLGLAGQVRAETTPLGCPDLGRLVSDLTGYSLTVPPSPNVEGWCIVDGAVLRAEGRPRITVERLQLSGSAEGDAPASLSMVIGGLRVVPDLSDRTMDARLRSMLRLQTVDATLNLLRSATFDGLELRDVEIVLSGGTRLVIEADLAGGGFSAAELIPAALTALKLEWRNDGRLLRPAMEAAGERLVAGAKGAAAVDAARQAVLDVLANLPEAALIGDTAAKLQEVVKALPQGQGRMFLDFTSASGIGAARLALLALADDPTSPEALGRLLAGSRVSVDWQPGMAP